MEKECNIDNNRLDPSEDYFRKKKNDNADIYISLQKNQKHLIIESIRKFIDRLFKINKEA